MSDSVETKTFPLGAVLTATSGKVLVENFGDFVKVAEHVTGISPLSTIDFASKTLVNMIKVGILLQYPDLAEFDPTGIDKSNWKSRMSVAVERYGAELCLTKGAMEFPAESGLTMDGLQRTMRILSLVKKGEYI